MTQALCFRCGDIKHGALNRCNGCGVSPVTDDEVMLSLAFTDHYFNLASLEQVGREIKRGNRPQLGQAARSKLYPAVVEAKRMTGIGRCVEERTAGKRH